MTPSAPRPAGCTGRSCTRRSAAGPCCSRSRSRQPVAAIDKAGGTSLEVIETALSPGLAKLVLDISTIGQLFCGMGCVAAA